MPSKQTLKDTIIITMSGEVNTTGTSPRCLALPLSLRETPLLLEKTNLDRKNYLLSRKKHIDPSPPLSGIYLYAPSVLGLWAVYAAEKEPQHFAGLVINYSQISSSFWLFVTRWRLFNERRLMGSDVLSPMMMRALRRHVEIAEHFTLTIGEWIMILEAFPKNIQRLSCSLFNLDSKSANTRIEHFFK